MKIRYALSLMFLLPFIAGNVNAWETDWLEQVEGFEGEKVGATVKSIELDSENTDQRVMTIIIPKESITIPDDARAIAVVEKLPAKESVKTLLNIEYKWVRDYDNDNYGLIIKLLKDQKYPIRLFLKAKESLEQ